MRPDQRPPADPGARTIKKMKRLGLLEVLPEDRDKPWGQQRLRKTLLGETHERLLRSQHPEWFQPERDT